MTPRGSTVPREWLVMFSVGNVIVVVGGGGYVIVVIPGVVVSMQLRVVLLQGTVIHKNIILFPCCVNCLFWFL